MSTNRRRNKRLRISRPVKVPVQVAPVLPFLGQTLPGESVNLSENGIALRVPKLIGGGAIKKGSRIRIHFRLPGHPIRSCEGRVRHVEEVSATEVQLGIRFSRLPAEVRDEIRQMSRDDQMCDERIEKDSNPWCLPTCSFRALCGKPIRDSLPEEGLELSLEPVI